jgi:hypothetical protein
VWVGVSRTLGVEALITRYIDPWFSEVGDDEDPIAELVRSFGAGPFGPGDYEVYSREYAREHLPNERFDYALFKRLAPFAQSAPGLQRIRHDELTCMFWVIGGKQPAIRSDANVEITDVLDVTFDWEQP